jgi:hypothetical protein
MADVRVADVVVADSGDAACPTSQMSCDAGCALLATDANNCGSCGHSCGGGTCVNGQCSAISVVSGGNLSPSNCDAGMTSITGLAADDANVYWSYLDGCDGTSAVKQAAGDGLPVLTLDSYDVGAGLSVQDNILAYVAIGGPSQGSFCTATGGVENSRSCSSLNQFFSYETFGAWSTPGSRGTFYVLVQGGSVGGNYYTADSCEASPSGQDGGMPCTQLALPGGTGSSESAGYIAYAPASNTVFWSVSASGANVAYSDVQTKVAGYGRGATGNGVFPTVTDGKNIYWIDNNSAILRIAAQAGTQTASTLLANGLAIPSSPTLATDGINVYFAATAPKSGLYYVPVAGGTPALLAASTGSGTPQSAVVGGSFLYWYETTPSLVIRRIATP